MSGFLEIRAVFVNLLYQRISVICQLNKNAFMKYILIIAFICYVSDGICQANVNDTLIYNEGSERLNRLLSREIGKSKILDSIRPDTYCNVNLRIDRTGQIQYIDIFTVGDSSYAKVIYNIMMQTDNKWSRSLDDGRILNVLFYFVYSKDGRDKDLPVKYYSDYFNKWPTNKVTKLGLLRSIQYNIKD
jgi:hypothetical protein